MTKSEFELPSYADIEEIKERANKMRAEAVREGFKAFFSLLASLPHRVAMSVRATAHS